MLLFETDYLSRLLKINSVALVGGWALVELGTKFGRNACRKKKTPQMVRALVAGPGLRKRIRGTLSRYRGYYCNTSTTNCGTFRNRTLVLLLRVLFSSSSSTGQLATILPPPPPSLLVSWGDDDDERGRLCRYPTTHTHTLHSHSTARRTVYSTQTRTQD